MYIASTLNDWNISREEIAASSKDYIRNNILLIDMEQQLVNQPEKIATILGFACDEGVRRNNGRTGARAGPAEFRKAFGKMAWYGNENFILDAGNVVCGDEKLEAAQNNFGGIIHQLLKHNFFPIGIGGGHEIAYAGYIGLSEALQKKRLGIINFDAHFDMRTTKDKLPNSGTSFYQIAEHCIHNNLDFNYLCLGIQQFSNIAQLFDVAREHGAQWIKAENLKQEYFSDLKSHLDRFMEKVDQIYLSICMDVFNVAHAPGVSAVNPLGIYPDFAMELFRYIFASQKVAYMDIAELNPKYDIDARTAKLVAAIVYNILGD